MVLVDVFPYINDTAITENLEGVRLPRGSQFANTFNLEEAVNVSILISGPGNTPYTPAHTVRYYNSDTAIDYGTGSTEDVLDGLPWSDSPATNTIAIRIELGEDLPANSLLRVIVPMKAPSNDNLSLSNLRAYNTFVRKDDSTRDLGGVSRYLEPNRIYNHIPMPTVDITLTKVGENPDEYLEGAVFELRDSAGVLVKRASTNPNGVINFPDVEIGDYTLTEVQAPTGYKLLPDSLIITEQMMIDAYNTGIALAIGPIVNEPVGPPAIIGSVIIEKLDANHVPLADFEFTIEGTPPADPPEQPGNTHIKMVGKSNAEGKIIFSNLPKGSYEITESGSVAPFLPVAPFNATIETQGQVIKFTLDNDPPNPIINDKVGLRVNKLGVFPESLCATAPYNPPSNCTYQSGTPLPSAQFSIFAANGDDLVDGPLTTNEQGYVDFPVRATGFGR